jgi:hypothetical protein
VNRGRSKPAVVQLLPLFRKCQGDKPNGCFSIRSSDMGALMELGGADA